MKWSEIPFHPGTRTLRQFAACWLVAFLVLAANESILKHRPTVGIVLAALAVGVGLPGLFRPLLLRPVFVGWMVIAFPIGWLVSLLMLAVLYYVVLTPVACLFRLRGREVFERGPATDRTSCWAPKETPLDVRSYFRQY